jgi:hypothetical protein
MDWFINGVDGNVFKGGVSTLRVYAQPGSKFKFEVSIGRVCENPQFSF